MKFLCLINILIKSVTELCKTLNFHKIVLFQFPMIINLLDRYNKTKQIFMNFFIPKLIRQDIKQFLK